MSIYAKLNAARADFHKMELKKSGKNTFANYSYFELGDFVIPAMAVLSDNGLCAYVSFTADLATMVIAETEGDGFITITSPMGGAALKGCHEVQNIGAVETYQRRYLWQAALEIVEHDALDATTGGDNRNVTQIAPTIDESQFAVLTTLVEQSGADLKALCTYYKVSSLSQLPAAQFAAVERQLKSKMKKAA
jgi:hypothetical protein